MLQLTLYRSHCWNEWELRRRALQMTNVTAPIAPSPHLLYRPLISSDYISQVRYKSTHSAQTDLSHFRRENVSQTFPAKTNATQTTVSTGTNPPKNVL